MSLKYVLAESRTSALKMLREKLPGDLTYHNFDHTLDVLHAAERIAEGEHTSPEEMELIRTAAVFHDTGYIYSRENHEELSCKIATEMLTAQGVDRAIIDRICDLILATRVPQRPKDKLSEILCDADLDYLGRDDYFPISENVYKEFLKFGIVKDKSEWKEMQIRFFESHHYFTPTAKSTRSRLKEEHLQRIRSTKY